MERSNNTERFLAWVQHEHGTEMRAMVGTAIEMAQQCRSIMELVSPVALLHNLWFADHVIRPLVMAGNGLQESELRTAQRLESEWIASLKQEERREILSPDWIRAA